MTEPTGRTRSSRPVWLGVDQRGWDHVRVHIQLLHDKRLEPRRGSRDPSKAIVLAVYLGLAAHAEIESGRARPGAELLGEYAGVDERTARDAVKVLERTGYIELERRPGKASLYFLKSPPRVSHPGSGSQTPGETPAHPGSDTRTSPGETPDEREPETRTQKTPPSPPEGGSGGRLIDLEGDDEPRAKVVRRVFDAWIESTGRTGRTVLDKKRRKLIVDRLKEGFTEAELLDAVRGWAHSAFHAGENDRKQVYNELHHMLRDAQAVERFRDAFRTQRRVQARDEVEGVRYL